MELIRQYLFSLDSGLSSQLHQVIKSLIATNQVDIIHILHSDLSASYLANLEHELSIFDIKLCTYKRQVPSYLQKILLENKLPINVYLFFWITKLPIQGRVIKLDIDITICDDLTDLFTIDILDAKIAAVHDNSIGSYNFSTILENRKHLYVNAGVVVFDMDKCSNDDLFAYMENLDLPSLLLHDQDVLNLFYADQIFYLKGYYNVSPVYLYIYTLELANLVTGAYNPLVIDELPMSIEQHRLTKNTPLSEQETNELSKLEKQSRIKIVHYLGISKPWKNICNPLASLWLMFDLLNYKQIRAGDHKLWRNIIAGHLMHDKLHGALSNVNNLFMYNYLFQFFEHDLLAIKAKIPEAQEMSLYDFIHKYDITLPQRPYEFIIGKNHCKIDTEGLYNNLLVIVRDSTNLIFLPPDIALHLSRLIGGGGKQSAIDKCDKLSGNLAQQLVNQTINSSLLTDQNHFNSYVILSAE